MTTDALPLTEQSPLRTRRFVDGPKYENLEMEERYLPRGATVLRLGAVYGEHDYQQRFEFVLRRVRAGRPRIPIGSGQFLFSRVYVGDVAAAVSLALSGDHRGEAFNVVEPSTAPYRLFAEEILAAANASDVELVKVRDDLLPADLSLSGALSQDLLMDSSKARAVLGWSPVDRSRRCARRSGDTSRTRRPLRPATSPRMTPYWGEIGQKHSLEPGMLSGTD
jgi:nucleoside-diphosphate-sugar epimerase